MLRALGERPSLIAGRGNRVSYFFMGRLMPRARIIRAVGTSMNYLFGPFRKGE